MTTVATKSRRAFSDFLLHLHPRSAPEETLRFRLSWGLGGMAAVLVGLLFLTGILLLLTYQPSTDHDRPLAYRVDPRDIGVTAQTQHRVPFDLDGAAQ